MGSHVETGRFCSFPQFPDRPYSVSIGGLSQWVKRPGYEDGQTFSSGVDVEKTYLAIPLSPLRFCGVVLKYMVNCNS